MTSKKRVSLFIDHANLFHIIKEKDIRIDYVRFRALIAENRSLTKAYVYMGVHDFLFHKKKKFIKYLMKNNFEVQTVPIKVDDTGRKRQTRIDICIYQDMTKLAETNAYDIAVLATGNGALYLAANRVKQLNKEVEIYSFKSSLARSLITAVGQERIIYIDDIIDEIILQRENDKAKN